MAEFFLLTVSRGNPWSVLTSWALKRIRVFFGFFFFFFFRFLLILSKVWVCFFEVPEYPKLILFNFSQRHRISYLFNNYFFPFLSSLIQDINWKYIRRLEEVLDVLWTFYVLSLSKRGWICKQKLRWNFKITIKDKK